MRKKETRFRAWLDGKSDFYSVLMGEPISRGKVIAVNGGWLLMMLAAVLAERFLIFLVLIMFVYVGFLMFRKFRRE